MANLTPASKARCLGVFPCGEGATGEQVASATAGHGQQAARGTQIFSSSRSHSVNCRMIPIKIGVLTSSWGPTPATVGLRDGLLELGYRENEQFVLGVRFTQGDLTALPGAARELVQYGVDIIFASEASPAKAAQLATTRIPIVFSEVSDPVGLGLIQSFARPGGNITGVADLQLELGPKRLEVFHELVPNLKRVLYPYDAADAYSVAGARMYREAAHRL